MLSYTRARLTPGFREETISRQVRLREAFTIHVAPRPALRTDDPVMITDTSLSYHVRYPGYTIVDKITFQADTPEELHPLIAAVGYVAYRDQQWGLLGTTMNIVAGTPWELDLCVADKLRRYPVDIAIALSVVRIDDLIPEDIDDCDASQLHSMVGELVEAGNDPDARLAFCELVGVM